MRKLFTLTAIVGLAGLSACIDEDSSLERAAVGGVVGCAAGEVLADGRCVEGAAVGAAVGVLTK